MRKKSATYPIPKSPELGAEDDGDQLSTSASGGAGFRKYKKAATAGVRAWLLLDSTGQTEVVKAGKQAIMRRTGLPAHDIRILVPFLSYHSAVLGREQALVINLEHIKAIINAHEVLSLNSKDPSVTLFVEQLQTRILRHHNALKSQEGGANTDEMVWRNLYHQEEPHSNPSYVSPKDLYKSYLQKEVALEQGKQASAKKDVLKLLPFEFVALEACLESVCSTLENEVKQGHWRTLELQAYLALDKLTSKISSRNLERVRQIKRRLISITVRVQKVRDELEHVLDDDQQMAEMYLTDKLLKENLEDAFMNNQHGTNEDVLQSDMNEETPVEISLEGNGGFSVYEGDLQQTEIAPEQLRAAADALSRGSYGIHTNFTHSVDIVELEMLLDAYFIQIEGTLNNLSTLREYVDDTEDYINIMLDDKQNKLLQMGVKITTATLMLTPSVLVCAILSINIQIPLFEQTSESMKQWVWTCVGCFSGSTFLYVVAIGWCKHRQLL